MPVVQLTKTFSDEQYARGLESWAWLELEGKTPLLSSLFGDVFLEDGDGAVWFLDSMEGTLERAFDSTAALNAQLATEDGQDEFLLAGLAFGAHARGLVLQDHEVYDFMPPLVLGGEAAVENLEASDFVVTMHIRGQIHDQIRGLPPGTKITGFNVEVD